MTTRTEVSQETTIWNKAYEDNAFQMVDDSGLLMVDDSWSLMVIDSIFIWLPVTTDWTQETEHSTTWRDAYEAEFGSGIDAVSMVDDAEIVMVDDDWVEMMFDYSALWWDVSTVWLKKQDISNYIDTIVDYDGIKLLDHDWEELLASLEEFGTNRTEKF